MDPTATSIVTSRRVQLQASLLTMSEQPPVSFGPTGLKFSLLNRTKAVMPRCTSVRRTATSMSSRRILAFRGHFREPSKCLVELHKKPQSVERSTPRRPAAEAVERERYRKWRAWCCRPRLNDGRLSPGAQADDRPPARRHGREVPRGCGWRRSPASARRPAPARSSTPG